MGLCRGEGPDSSCYKGPAAEVPHGAWPMGQDAALEEEVQARVELHQSTGAATDADSSHAHAWVAQGLVCTCPCG